MRHRAPTVFSLYTAGGQRKYLTPIERARFIAAAKASLRKEIGALCLTIIYTGCRITETLNLTRACVEPDAGFIAIRSLKKRNGAMVMREVPVPAELLAMLCADPTKRATDRLWVLSRSRAWQLIKEVMTLAGIAPGIHATPRGLRHSFGVHAVRSSVPLNFVQRWLGHARMETTAIYLQAMGSEERDIAGRMWDTDVAKTSPLQRGDVVQDGV